MEPLSQQEMTDKIKADMCDMSKSDAIEYAHSLKMMDALEREELEKRYQDNEALLLRRNAHLKSQLQKIEGSHSRKQQAFAIESLKFDRTMLERELYLYRLGFFALATVGVTYLTMYFLGVA